MTHYSSVNILNCAKKRHRIGSQSISSCYQSGQRLETMASHRKQKLITEAWVTSRVTYQSWTNTTTYVDLSIHYTRCSGSNGTWLGRESRPPIVFRCYSYLRKLHCLILCAGVRMQRVQFTLCIHVHS